MAAEPQPPGPSSLPHSSVSKSICPEPWKAPASESREPLARRQPALVNVGTLGIPATQWSLIPLLLPPAGPAHLGAIPGLAGVTSPVGPGGSRGQVTHASAPAPDQSCSLWLVRPNLGFLKPVLLP